VWDQQRKKTLGVRIMLGVVVGLLGAGMLLYLLPGQGTTSQSSADVVAQVDDQAITMTDVNQQLSRLTQNGAIPPALKPLYVQQVLNELVFEKELGIEARLLGFTVSDQERADRIKQLIPTAFMGGSFVGNDQYAAQVQERVGMGVPQFEDLVGQSLLEEKFRQLVTDGITVTPSEIEQEFRRRNEKVKINYVVIKPDDLQSKIEASDADLAAYFEKDKARYTIPERRTVSYALLDFDQLRAHANVPDEEIKAYYDQHIDTYKLPDRAHVAHILFKTVGKTDAEVEEIRKKAEDVLKKAKSGANFGDLAKQYSEDTTKDKGGDLDWIVRGQTVPEFEQAAFSLPKGSVSDLVKTQYGFHIIKVIDRQNARTQTLDEVRPQILATLQQDRANRAGEDTSDQIAAEIRRLGKVSIDDLGKKFNMTVGETQPLEATQAIPEVGNSPEISDTIFRLRVGDVSPPIRTDKGYAVLSVKTVQPSHAATLAEVRDKVLADFRRDKAVDLAKSRADELAKRSKAGEDLTKAAKALGFDAKTSDLFARNGTVPDAGSASQFLGAFTLPEGQTADPVFLGVNWVVYRLVQHQPADPNDLAKQRSDIETQLLESRRDMAFDAFRKSLDTRMKQEGKLKINADNLKRLGNPSTS
jgi:peptidyl-prolyl cis-trans isomerase D